MIITVDPGKKGAIAWQLGLVTYVENMPETRGDAIALIKRVQDAVPPGESITCFHEKVASYIPDGGASQMFEFGRNVERIGCIVETLGIPLIEIPPKEWQKLLNLGASNRTPVPRMPRGLSLAEKKDWKYLNAVEIKAAKAHNAKGKRDWKNKLKAEAQRRYPDIKVTLLNADALLMLSAAQRYNS
jgi:hypothetical protein